MMKKEPYTTCQPIKKQLRQMRASYWLANILQLYCIFIAYSLMYVCFTVGLVFDISNNTVHIYSDWSNNKY